jgi:hypothetical protein
LPLNREPKTQMNIAELQAQRVLAEGCFTAALGSAAISHELAAEIYGYHREVNALYAAELSLVSSGRATAPADAPKAASAVPTPEPAEDAK